MVVAVKALWLGLVLATVLPSAMAAPVASVPLQFANQHAYVEVAINGKRPFLFLLDTGASGPLLTKEAAGRLHLKSLGLFVGGGGGGGKVHYVRSRVASIAIGGAVVHNVDIVISPSSFVYFPVVEGIRCDGAIGYDFFAKYVAQIDPKTARLTLWSPPIVDKSQLGIAIPFKAAPGGPPVVRASIDGIPGDLWIDTGFRATALIFTPFVRAHRLYASPGRLITTTASWGVGGPVRATLHRGTLSFGGLSFKNAILQLSTLNTGFDASTGSAGLVGMGIFRNYVMTLDYSKHVMYLRANSPLPFEDSWDRLGAWINRGRGGFEVVDLTANAPAADAGMRVGDVILAINGIPSSSISLSDARALFRNKETMRVRVTYRRRSSVETIAIPLVDLI